MNTPELNGILGYTPQMMALKHLLVAHSCTIVSKSNDSL